MAVVKIVETEQAFKPVTIQITLNTLDELNALYQISSHEGGVCDLLKGKTYSDEKATKEVLSSMFDVLNRFIRAL